MPPFFPERRGFIWLGGGVALGMAMPSYWTLSWFLHRANREFYPIFLGGILGRLAGLLATAYFTHRIFPTALPTVLLSLLAGLAFLSIIEMFFLHKQAMRPQ